MAFVKGNKEGAKSKGVKKPRLPEKIRNIQECGKEQIIKCTEIFSYPYSDLLKNKDRKDISILEKLTYSAAYEHDYKFVMWLFEMAIGRPKQRIDVADQDDKNNGEYEQVLINDLAKKSNEQV
jgi:hypothetical protein